MTDIDVVAHNRDAWDRQAAAGDEWTRGVSPEMVAAARAGDLSGVVLIGHKPIIREWLPADLTGVRILGLASGGGQQGPLLAAAGALVVCDLAPNLSAGVQLAARTIDTGKAKAVLASWVERSHGR